MQQKDQERFSQALELLRNDEARFVRIGIDTDSMTFVDKGLQTQRLNAAVTTVTQGLKQAAEMLQTSPDFALKQGFKPFALLNQRKSARSSWLLLQKAIQDLLHKQRQQNNNPPPST